MTGLLRRNITSTMPYRTFVLSTKQEMEWDIWNFKICIHLIVKISLLFNKKCSGALSGREKDAELHASRTVGVIAPPLVIVLPLAGAKERSL